MRHLLLILSLIFTIMSANAQTYSYVYIQGDKQTPFYVKLEGDMLPRYGKNYCIIPRLEAGVINIDILFQQNAYPAQHFVINVPENGSRGFYLTQKNGSFSLFDLQQQFYLPAGNTAADDRLPATPTAIAAVSPETGNAATAAKEPETMTVEKKPGKKETAPKVKTVKTKPVHTVTPPVAAAQPADNGQPNFLGDIELDREKSLKPVTPDTAEQRLEQEAQRKADSLVQAMKNEPQPAVTPTPAAQEPTANSAENQAPAANTTVPAPVSDTLPAVVNSDCPRPLADELLETIYKKTMQQNDEEARLGYLLDQMGNCYTSTQARILAKTMDTDAARYTFLKKIYSRITDQEHFASLAGLLSTEEWRGYFNGILKH